MDQWRKMPARHNRRMSVLKALPRLNTSPTRGGNMTKTTGNLDDHDDDPRGMSLATGPGSTIWSWKSRLISVKLKADRVELRRGRGLWGSGESGGSNWLDGDRGERGSSGGCCGTASASSERVVRRLLGAAWLMSTPLDTCDSLLLGPGLVGESGGGAILTEHPSHVRLG
ncbi:hypothetical protein VTK26DRAFT_2728 [Humicola hyalothermophila]